MMPFSFDPGRRVLGVGGGGCIAGRVVREHRAGGSTNVRCLDIKPIADWHQISLAAENVRLGLRDRAARQDAVKGADVFNLAADTGRMGFIGATSSGRYDPSEPKGVHGRNSDNRGIREQLGRELSTLMDGMRSRGRWIEAQSDSRNSHAPS